MNQFLLESYRVNLQTALTYGQNDVRGIQALANVQNLLKQMSPEDIRMTRDIDQRVVQASMHATYGMSAAPKILYLVGGNRNGR